MELFQQEKRDWTAPGIKGTCSQMCPVGEIAERRKFNQVHTLERNPYNEEDSSFMIKKYYRSQTEETRQNSYLRDRVGIALTMDRLRVVMDIEAVPFETRASFIWDRYRAVWKDMSIQNWQDIFRVAVLEEMVRFLIFADFKIALEESQSPGLSYQDAYDAELGIQLLLQCFVTLSELYQTLRDRQQPCPNELEFRIYHTLLQMTPVEGREMEHEEISLLFRTFPEDLLNEDASSFEQLRYLYEMEFFEFALGRRILERFREIRFKKYFRRLRQRSTLTSQPPMPLHEFCDRFFLDQTGARQFAEAHSMRMETDHEGKEYIIIHEGIRRPKVKFIPKIGAGIPSWGFIDGQISISHFVCQHPSPVDNPHFNFVYKELICPSYHRALHEWSFLSQLYNISEFGSALLQSAYWRKLNRLECFYELPVLKEWDEEGNEVLPPYPLPFFRTIDGSKIIEIEEEEEPEIADLKTPIELEKIQEDKPETTEKTEEEMKISYNESFFGVVAGQNEGFWVPTSQPLILTPPQTEILRTIQSSLKTSVVLSDFPNPSPPSELQEMLGMELETVESSGSQEVGRIYSHSFSLSKEEFEEIVSRGRLKRHRYEMQTVGVQHTEENPLSTLQPADQSPEILADNAEELFNEYCTRVLAYRPISGWTHGEERQKFNSKLSRRYRRILEFEKSLPDGWRIRPKRRRQLMKINSSWKEPEIVPKTFPPQLTEHHLLKSMETHSLVQKNVLDEILAKKIMEDRGLSGDVSCSLVLLTEGPMDENKITQKWLTCRVLHDMDSTTISEDVRMSPDGSDNFHLTVQLVDMKKISEQDFNRVHTASGFLLLVEDTSKMEETFRLLRETLASFMEGDQMPPLVIFDGREMQPGLIHEDSILIAGESSELEIFTRLAHHFDCSMLDVFAVSLSHHLGILIRSIFRDLCEKWKSFLANEFIPREELMVKEDAEIDFHDPIKHAIQLLTPSLILKETPRTESRGKRNVDSLVVDWKKEWERIKNWGELLNIRDGEALCRMDYRQQAYLDSASKKSFLQKRRKNSFFLAPQL